MRSIIYIYLLILAIQLPAQITISTTPVPDPEPSSILEVRSDSKGVLVPRLTSVQREAIANPAQGLLVFDSSSNSFWYYAAGAWREIGGGGSGVFIRDADGNTVVSTEKTPNDDAVRIDLAGVEKFVFHSNASGQGVFEVQNSGANLFLGFGTGTANANGDNNTFVGYLSGAANSSASFNTFVGSNAGFSNTTGANNTFAGVNAGRLNIDGGFNVFVGESAGYNNSAGFSNVMVGNSAGYFNTAGHDNTNIGTNAGKGTTLGNFNTFLGSHAGLENTTGNHNVFLGVNAGRMNATGNDNVMIGLQAGSNLTTGSGNVLIGKDAGNSELANATNRLFIENSSAGKTGALIYGEFDNDLVRINNKLGIGRDPGALTLEINGTHASKGQAGSWAGSSDRRLKKHIRYLDDDPGAVLQQVLRMRGVTYEWNDTRSGITRPTGLCHGFIAQDLQQIWPGKVWSDADGYLQTAYGDYDPLFVESFRALNLRDKALEEENTQLKRQVVLQQKLLDDLNTRLEALETLLSKH